MSEILDDLPKITTRSLKKLFTLALYPQSYLKEHYPHFDYTAQGKVGGIEYHITLLSDMDVDREHFNNREITDPADFKGIHFAWKYGGKPMSMQVCLYEMRIEGKRSYFYFVCPETDTRCTALYVTREGYLRSRKAIAKTGGAYYRSQYKKNSIATSNKSGGYRRICMYLNLLKIEGENPHKKYGKEYYRGKLTPYGKRVQRYEDRLRNQLQVMNGEVVPLKNL